MSTTITERPVELPKIADTLEEAIDWLETFEDADALAEWFKIHGVKGLRCWLIECPISVVLTRMLSRPVAVDACCASNHPLGHVAQAFVQRFDQGEYPDLLA